MEAATTSRKKYTYRRVACLGAATAMLLVGLWPFDFFPVNNVRWLPDRDGLRFDRPGIVFTRDPVFGSDGGIELTKPWTIALEVTPHDEPSDFLPRILSVFDSDGHELLILAQWKSELILKILQGERHFRLRYKEFDVRTLHARRTRSIAISSDDAGLSLFADGVPVATVSRSTMALPWRRHESAWLALGNSPTGESPWKGDFHYLSIHSAALSPGEIRVSEDSASFRSRFSDRTGAIWLSGGGARRELYVPEVFRPPKKGILIPPWKVQRFGRSFWEDVAVNVLGFIPFGIVAAAWLRGDSVRKPVSRDAVATAILLGGMISLTIELLQAYLPTRDSSLTDVLTNLLGTSTGTLFPKTRRMLNRRPSALPSNGPPGGP